MLRLRDLAEVRRAYADPPQPLFRVNGEPALGLAISMREGGDILALGKTSQAEMANIVTDLPIGIQAQLVADQASTVDEAISDFTTSLWQAILIVLAVSFIALGVRAGTVVAIAIPLTLAIVFPDDGSDRYRPPARLAGRADHSAGIAGGRCVDDRRRDDAAARGRRPDGSRGGIRL